jgi:two-component system chemotaxis response regulator CheB
MNKIIVIGASSGGLKPLRHIIAALPIPCTASVFIVMHLGNHPSILPSVLAASTRLNVSFAKDGSPIQPGRIYVAPPDHHMLLELGRVRLNRGPKVRRTRPAADPLFISAAEIYGERVIGVVLSGGDGDGAEGLRSIKDHGGEALVQHPEDAAVPSMPKAAIVMDHPDACSVEEIAKRVKSCR